MARYRLEYTGNMEKWEFAIYKYSDERYDPEEWFSEEASGWNYRGRHRAGLQAYPT